MGSGPFPPSNVLTIACLPYVCIAVHVFCGFDRLSTPQVIGVGGGGSNAVKRMMESEIQGVDFWSLNTDVQVTDYKWCRVYDYCVPKTKQLTNKTKHTHTKKYIFADLGT